MVEAWIGKQIQEFARLFVLFPKKLMDETKKSSSSGVKNEMEVKGPHLDAQFVISAGPAK